MILTFLNIQLRRIDQEDIEMLRQWRNDQKIVQFMFFNKHITKEMQQQWFDALGPKDFYFIIEYKNKALGLINLSSESNEERAAQAGLFIYDESYWGTQIPVIASLCLLEFAFEQLGLKTIYAKVQKKNTAAKNYNRSLGFKDVTEELQDLDEAAYMHRVQPLKKRIANLKT